MKYSILLLLLILTYFITPNHVNAQSNDWINFIFGKSGIPDNDINDIVFDNIGNKWLATFGGLAKFDGSNWEVYNSTNSELPEDDIRALAIDSSGRVWIGARRKGLSSYFEGNWIIYDSINNFISQKITSISVDKNNIVWFGTLYNGVFKYENNTFTIYDSLNSALLSNWISDIAIDNDNNKWFASISSLIKYDGTNWTFYKTDSLSNLPFLIISCIEIDKNHIKWLGTTRGLIKYDNITWKVNQFPNYGLNDRIDNLAFDKSNNIWVGTGYINGKGVFKFDGDTWTNFNTSNSEILDNNVISLGIDKYDNVWIGTYGSGLSVYREGGPILAVNDNKITDDYISMNIITNTNHVNINLKLANDGNLKIKLYDLIGVELGIIINETFVAGDYSRDIFIPNLTSGCYIITSEFMNKTITKKFLVYPK